MFTPIISNLTSRRQKNGCKHILGRYRQRQSLRKRLRLSSSKNVYKTQLPGRYFALIGIDTGENNHGRKLYEKLFHQKEKELRLYGLKDSGRIAAKQTDSLQSATQVCYADIGTGKCI